VKAIIILFALLCLAGMCNSSNTPSIPPGTPEQIKEDKGNVEVDLGLKWNYENNSDEMGRGNIKHAWVKSKNKVNFDFPYHGPQRATLSLRLHPKYGKDIILNLNKAHFLCGIDGCYMAVRFDEGKVQNFTAHGPSDHSTNTLFLSGYDRFVAEARKAKTVRVETKFYQQGNQVFEFDVSGLQWQDAPSTKKLSTDDNPNREHVKKDGKLSPSLQTVNNADSNKNSQSIVEQTYWGAVTQRIKSFWVLPEMRKWNSSLLAQVVITISKDGYVTNIQFDQRSKDPLFDQLVEKTIKSSAPMPRFPALMQQESTAVGFKFRPGELGNM